MFDHARAFKFYTDNRRDELIVALLVWLPRWAKDVLRYTSQDGNYSFEEDLVSAGTEYLIEEVNKRLDDKRMESGQHLVNSLRIAIRKKMKNAHVALLDAPPDLVQETEQGDGSLLHTYESPTQIEMDFLEDGHPGNRWPDALVCQDHGDRKQRLLQAVARVAVQEARGVAAKVVDKLLAGEKSVSAAAKAAGVPRETGRDQLKRLGKKIISDASSELKAQLLELNIAA